MPPNRLPAVASAVVVAVIVAAASLLCSKPVHAGFACLSGPCVHGVCVDQLNSTYTCYCIDGYTGVHCQTNWDECWSSPCLNGGVCLDGVADYNCSCLDGYAGHDCELNINECLSNPCQNNGTCMDFINEYSCQCPVGYTGTNCEVDLAVCNSTGELLCKNGGECIEGPGMSFSCKCSPGWNGRICEDEIDQCYSRPCKNGGVCINKQTAYSCACLFGYTGHDCDVALRLCDENQCQNHALCLVEDQKSVCYCVPDYHGKYCQYQYDECQLGIRCENGGTCVDGVDGYTCTCPVGSMGESCECRWDDDDRTSSNCSVTPSYNVSSAERSTTTGRPHDTGTTAWPGDGIPVKFGTTFGTSKGAFATDFSIYVTAATTPFGYYSYEDAVSSPVPTTEPASDRYTMTAGTVTETAHFERTDHQHQSTESRWTYGAITEAGTKPSARADDGIATKTHESDTTPMARRYSTTENDVSLSTRRSAAWSTSYSTAAGTPRTTEPTKSTTTASIPPPKSTINYHGPVVTEQDVAFTTFYEEMSTDFDYNFTGFTDPRVTDHIPSSADKSCTNVLCLNGGTCETSKSRHKCKCSFGWTGETCAEKIAIKVSAFTGRSFLSHRLSNRSGAEISMEIRTLAPNGILFYAQVTTHMYMCLYLQDGLLKFQFSCGVQTMLFSETRYRVNTGHRLLLTAALEHAVSHSMSDHCKASLRVNETLAMSGEQAADTSSTKTAKKIALLFLGGLPPGQNTTVELPVTAGITGCISRLQIDEAVHNVYENATDGYGVIECASLTCLSSPCQSYATCVEYGDSWNCLCPSGFVGKNCERSVCENNPCKFGATCVIYPGSGFICLCPLGKHGMYCEHDLEISEPFFPGSVSGLSSFAAYSIPAEIHQSFELSMHFVPNFMDQISLMMYIGHDASTDHVALSFIKGYIVLTWNLGAGARRIFTPKPINFQPKKTHVVKLGRYGKTAWLAVDNFPNVTGQSVGRLSQLNTKPILYLGGHESPGMSDLPHDLPLHTGFVGCMSSVKLMAGHVTVPLSLSRAYSTANIGRSVSQCSTNECYRNNICQHSGACIQHGSSLACVCDDGWFGPVCSHRYNACDATRHNCSGGSTCVPVGDGYECDCPAGRSGKYCDRDERLSDVRFLGKRSFMSVPTVELNTQQFSVELEIKPYDEHGIVFFIKHDATRKMFLCLSLYGGVLELRITVQVSEMRRQDNILVVRSGRVLTLSEWHSVRVGRYRRKLYLWVDGMVNYAILQPSEGISEFENLIYFGGLPDLSSMPLGSTTGLPVSFTGCIRRLSIDYDTITLNYSSIAEGRNIADCDGTPCGGDLCHHGGSCWLDMDMKPHCHCLQEFTGESCNKQVPCTEFKCQNKGHCIIENGNTSFACKCPPGWDGPFCTKELPTGPPLFKGHGYLVLSKLSSLYKREDNDEVNMNNEIQSISLNFSTVYDNGLLIWTSQEEWYLGLGIINGLLTATWAQKYKRPNKLISSLSNITNGEWHTARLNITKSDIILELDNWISDTYQHNVESFNLNDNIIYLGGVPEEKYFLNDRQELFKGNFRGCIEQLTVQENVITDFKHYDSVNVDVCDIW